jgi:uncharacterized membrane protein YbhN (UPF0104 family)
MLNENSRRWRSRLAPILLRYTLGFGLLAWVVWRHWSIRSPEGEEAGIHAVLERPVQLWPLTLACFISLASMLLTILRWFLLTRAQKLALDLASAVRLGLIGLFFNTLLPGAVSGDLVKIVLVGRTGEPRSTAAATVLADRLIGLFGLVCLVALGGSVLWAAGVLPDLALEEPGMRFLQTTTLTAIVLSLAGLCGWCIFGALADRWVEAFAARLALIWRIGPALENCWRAFCPYRRVARPVAAALAVSMVVHFGSVLVFYWAACTVFPAQDVPSFAAHLVLVPVGMIVRAGFPTPGGIGGAEFIFGSLYAMVGFAFAGGVLASLVVRVISYFFAFAGFLVYSATPTRTVSEDAPH